MNIRVMLQDAAHRFAAISSTPQLDAELLLSHVIHQPRSVILAWPERVLTSTEKQAFLTMVQARAAGEPIAYLLGRQEFWSLELRVTRDTLIPRPETETLIESFINQIASSRALDWTLADLGTGSGAIAIALAKEFPHSHIIATDQLKAALQIAEENAKNHGVSNILFQQGDWYHALEGLPLDAIFSNPPYIASDDPALDPFVLKYEPRQALIADDAGFSALSTIIRGAPAFLKPGGWLLLEHGWQQGVLVRDACQEAGFHEITTVPDLAGNERVTIARFSSINKKK